MYIGLPTAPATVQLQELVRIVIQYCEVYVFLPTNSSVCMELGDCISEVCYVRNKNMVLRAPQERTYFYMCSVFFSAS